MERALGLMAGAGVLPGRAAAEASRQGWRVVAFAFDDAPDLDTHADAVIPSRLEDISAVLSELASRGVSAALFVGKFAKQRVFAQRGRNADAAALGLARQGLSDGALGEMVVATLAQLGIEVLDQRQFFSPLMAAAGVLTARGPTAEELAEMKQGFAVAHHLAALGIGQTVVRALGVTVAVEAIEGTDETIRRGTALAGPGAVVIKAVAPSQDYRFDIPTVGLATLEAMIGGGATALGIAGGRLLVMDREEVIRRADHFGIAVAGLDG